MWWASDPSWEPQTPQGNCLTAARCFRSLTVNWLFIYSFHWFTCINCRFSFAYSFTTAILAFLPRRKFTVFFCKMFHQYFAVILAGFGLDEAGTTNRTSEVIGSGNGVFFCFFTGGATHADFSWNTLLRAAASWARAAV